MLFFGKRGRGMSLTKGKKQFILTVSVGALFLLATHLLITVSTEEGKITSFAYFHNKVFQIVVLSVTLAGLFLTYMFVTECIHRPDRWPWITGHQDEVKENVE
jgi:hypothetical protein